MDETQNQNAPVENKKMSNQKIIIIVVVVLLVLWLAKSILSPERMVERMIERATDGAYDIDLDKDGGFEMTGQDGEKIKVSGGSGRGMSLPKNWPETVPVVAGAEIEYVATVNEPGGGESSTVTYYVDDELDSVVEYYQNNLNSKGWQVEATIATGDGTMMSATKGDDDTVSVSIMADSDGKTYVTVSAVTE